MSPATRRKAVRALRRHRATLVAVALCCGFFAFLAVAGNRFDSSRPGVSNRLAEAFLDGRAWLDVEPPAGLLALRDPHDPAQSAPYRRYPVEDLSLFEGRFYAYWGPVPTLLVFVPLRLLGWETTPESLVVLLFALLGMVFGALLLLAALRRWRIASRPWQMGLAVLTVGLTNGLIFSLGSAQVWQVAIAAGAAFLLASLWCLLRTEETGRLGPALAASACLGLAVGSRWSLAVFVLPWLVAAAWATRRAPVERRRRLLVALLVPLVACLAVLSAYNHARFGSVLDTGMRYQITTVNWHAHGLGGSLSILPTGLSYYLLHPLVVRATFPYLFADTRELSPGTLEHVEPMTGLVWVAPILILLALLPWAVRRRPGLVWPALWTVGTGAAMLLILSALPANAMRYNADYLTLLVIPALVVWLLASREAPHRSLRRAATALGAGLCLVGLITSTALAISQGSAVRVSSPETFRSLDRFFAPLPTLASAAAGRPFLASVEDFPVLPPRRPGMRPSDFAVSDSIVLRVVSGSSRVVRLRSRMEAVGGPVTIRVRQGSQILAEGVADGGVQNLSFRVARGLTVVTLQREAPPGSIGHVLLRDLEILPSP